MSACVRARACVVTPNHPVGQTLYLMSVDSKFVAMNKMLYYIVFVTLSNKSITTHFQLCFWVYNTSKLIKIRSFMQGKHFKSSIMGSDFYGIQVFQFSYRTTHVTPREMIYSDNLLSCNSVACFLYRSNPAV